jgi:hypothetical protein
MPSLTSWLTRGSATVTAGAGASSVPVAAVVPVAGAGALAVPVAVVVPVAGAGALAVPVAVEVPVAAAALVVAAVPSAVVPPTAAKARSRLAASWSAAIDTPAVAVVLELSSELTSPSTNWT